MLPARQKPKRFSLRPPARRAAAPEEPPPLPAASPRPPCSAALTLAAIPLALLLVARAPVPLTHAPAHFLGALGAFFRAWTSPPEHRAEAASAAPAASRSTTATATVTATVSASGSTSGSSSLSPSPSSDVPLPAFCKAAAPAAPFCPPLRPGVCPANAAAPGERVQWAVVVQGQPYWQALRSWSKQRLAMEDQPWPAGDSLLRIFSTWDTYKDDGFVQAYRDGGFEVVFSDWEAFLANNTAGGAGNVNLQMQTSHAGLARARALGATHAFKTRGDVRVAQPRVFLECVLGVPRTVSFSTMWHTMAPRYALEHLVAGPIADVQEYFSPPFKAPDEGRFPELYLMEEYSRKRGWAGEDGPTHGKFCREVEWWFPRLPKGVFFFEHKGQESETSDFNVIGPDSWLEPCKPFPFRLRGRARALSLAAGSA